MKCLVLAGGSGDALWPLSRRNYPKQFINMQEGRSLFQETIARNLPFCDEFYIITNSKYEYIVKGQMQYFQGLSYHLYLEQVGKQTAPAVAVISMLLDNKEDMLIVSTDHLISEGDYNQTIIKAFNLLKPDNMVVLGTNPEWMMKCNALKGCGGFKYEDSKVIELICDCSQVEVDGNVLLDSGIFITIAGTYCSAIKKYSKSLYKVCAQTVNEIVCQNDSYVIPSKCFEQIVPVSIGEAVFANLTDGRLLLYEAEFQWVRLLSAETLDFIEGKTNNINEILNDCQNVSVVNDEKDCLVVVNKCSNLAIINAKDAIYISDKQHSEEIKAIMSSHNEKYHGIFDEGYLYYASWGTKEILNRSKGYIVRKITIYPGNSIFMHKHENRSEHWSIVDGIATITLANEVKEYQRNDNVFVPPMTYHKIENKTAKDLTIIEVSIGESAGLIKEDILTISDDFVKLLPTTKDYLWGGHRLHEKYGKISANNKEQMIAESWEVSAHSAGVSTIASGEYQNMPFDKYLECIGKQALGWKCQPFERFPLMVKFIDAKEALSVQVHPDDAYALQAENDYGKNEMWYVVDATEDAAIYLGFSKEVSKDECKERIDNGTLTEVLNKIPVKTGDVIFVKAGTVHAILEGVFVLEIQQSSNATYRLYDYKRKDKNGMERPLHINKAMDNIIYGKSVDSLKPVGNKEYLNGFTKQLLGECKYFSVQLYEIENKAELSMDETSFRTLVFLEGEGKIISDKLEENFKAGDSFFVPARKKMLTIIGQCKLVLSKV